MTESSLNECPEISVLMSCYNAERWLHEAIDSVLNQTFKNFELILVDDGSTDETWNIIKSYRVRDARIVTISKNNTGLADSLNVGIAQARGVWIARLDADDLSATTRLDEQRNYVHDHPDIVLLGSGFVEIDEHGKKVLTHKYPSDHRALVRHLEYSKRFFPHSSAFYRTDIVRQVGGYNHRIRRAEDLRLWLELSTRGTIACLSGPLVNIRKHSSQISLENSGSRQLYDGIAATICHHLCKAGHEDPSSVASEEEWNIFLCWVEHRLEKLGYLKSCNAWSFARANYFASENRLLGAVRMSSYLLRSGFACRLMLQKIYGTNISKLLSEEWIKQFT